MGFEKSWNQKGTKLEAVMERRAIQEVSKKDWIQSKQRGELSTAGFLKWGFQR